MYIQRRNLENLQLYFPNEDELAGQYQIPIILDDEIEVDSLPDDYISFNYAKSYAPIKRSNAAVHFFCDDYQFERVWEKPNEYINMLSQFRYVFSPDFSLYSNMPKSVQIYNAYRRHWLAMYWQRQGIDVIPTISWSDESSYEWCFDGEPTDSIVGVSSVGTQQNTENKAAFINGYRAMEKAIHPKAVIFYGKIPEELENDEKIIKIGSFTEKIQQRILDKDRKE